jgi:hypothetical protein
VDRPAVPALEVQMGLGAAVVAGLLALEAGQADRLTLLLQDVEVAVDRAEADPRQLLADAPVEFARRGVRAAGLQFLENDLPLAGVAALAAGHVRDPFMRFARVKRTSRVNYRGLGIPCQPAVSGS